ncbi:MAG: purine-nucleoside phosphorylase [Acidobacteria bacterium]|nr:purine-nucleoside phosphorylase [Acidobacteriota bacterium]
MDQAIDYLAPRIGARPEVGVVLGSGLGAFADELAGARTFPYGEVPGWPQSTAVGHAGKLVFGGIVGRGVAVMSGRAHLYEGHPMHKVVFGVCALARLGVRAFVFTNAAGGINLSYGQGALVLISDHINLQGTNPLLGPNDESLGPRFPDMSDAYDPEFRATAKAVGAGLGVDLPEGVYAGLLGPSYETPAEIRYLRAIGADLVGMSTVGEVIAARHMGIRCMAISCVTNMAAGILPQKINHEEVLETGARVRSTLVALLRTLIPRLEI